GLAVRRDSRRRLLHLARTRQVGKLRPVLGRAQQPQRTTPRPLNAHTLEQRPGGATLPHPLRLAPSDTLSRRQRARWNRGGVGSRGPSPTTRRSVLPVKRPASRPAYVPEPS